MAHSKNDVPFFGGTLRQRTNTKKGIPTVECALIDPNTTCPYTNAELYRALLRRSEERPALASAVEHEIREIAEKANDNPNAEFRVQCSGKTKADAEKRAKKELHPRLALIAKLLYRPLWESSVAGGRPTVADFVEYMGDDLFRAATPGDRPNLMSALRTAILPIIKDKRLDELVSEEQVKKEKDKINRLLTKTHAKDTKRRNVKRAYTILFRIIVESGFAGCKNALELADSIEMTKQQNRKLSNSILPGHLDAHQRCSLFTLLSDQGYYYEQLIVALVYSGLDLREIAALTYDDIDQLTLCNEICLTITVDKIVCGQNSDATVAGLNNDNMPVKRLRKVVLYPWAADILRQYVERLQKEGYTFAQIEKMRLSYSIWHKEALAPFQMEAAIKRLLRKAGIPSIPIPHTREGKTEMTIKEPSYSLLYLDAQYIAGLCGANLPMLHAMFGMAWTEMDEESYLDLLSDQYAVARYLHLKRFSPYEPALLKRRVLMVQNSTQESQNFSISSHYAISARWRKKHDDKNH